MLRELSTVQCEALERMIDTASLSALLDAISVICNSKAEHIASNWQDEGLAAYWQAAANHLLDLSNECQV
jgi:hypothetical protein